MQLGLEWAGAGQGADRHSCDWAPLSTLEDEGLVLMVDLLIADGEEREKSNSDTISHHLASIVIT